ncbi:MAG: toprim domain-containing protein [Chitinophagaceae bacterium]
MKNNKNVLTCEQVKQIDMVDYLASLGYHPSTIRNNDYWYLSPLRLEKTASFKINRKLNSWYDHGLGKGGNLIDFGIQYHLCSVKDFLLQIGNKSFPQQPLPLSKTIDQPKPESQIKVLAERPLVSLPLIRYLTQRRISLAVANTYCREINFELNGKAYHAIGFANGEEGYELRNAWFKGSSSPKAITFIGNNSKVLSVFEGFFDFLSYQTIHQNQELQDSNFLILNSTSFFEKSRPVMEEHKHIKLFLDRDATGQNCIRRALAWSKKYNDESELYTGYKDLNEWAQQIGKKQNSSMKQRIK